MASRPHVDLPPGWWFYQGSRGRFDGPPLQDQIPNGNEADRDDSSEEDSELDINPDSDGWEDQELDVEAVKVSCLLCDNDFPSTNEMLLHCNTAHQFDFLATVRRLGLDFYGTIRYINWIRRNVRDGATDPALVNSPDILLQGDELLKPVLEDDALIYELDEVIDHSWSQAASGDEVAESSTDIKS